MEERDIREIGERLMGGDTHDAVACAEDMVDHLLINTHDAQVAVILFLLARINLESHPIRTMPDASPYGRPKIFTATRKRSSFDPFLALSCNNSSLRQLQRRQTRGRGASLSPLWVIRCGMV